MPINISNIRTGSSEKLLDNSNFEDFMALNEYGICENYFSVNILEPELNSCFSTYCFAITVMEIYPSIRTSSKKYI